MKLATITGPAFYAQYLIVGDSSGLTPEEIETADAFRDRNGIFDVQAVEEGSERFTWALQIHDPGMAEFGVLGGMVCDYVCEMREPTDATA